ncbi:MAG: transporter [Chitinophagaceae bacterium]
MKKILILVMLASFTFTQLRACDICGCGVGNSYVGILPDFNKHIFGFRFRYNSLFSHVGVGGASSYLTSKEQYKTIEFWGGWNIGQRFRVMASVPYSFDERTNEGTTKTKSGPGDIFVAGFYQLVNGKQTVGGRLLIQTLWIGGGIKAPTGKYNPVDKLNTTESANLFQLGTGSTDFTLNAMYDIRLQDAGVNASATYKMNTANKYSYRYGNKLSLNAQAYYKFRVKNKFTVAPNAGVMFEKGQKDIDHMFAVDISGGNLTMTTAGMEIAFKKISVGGNFQVPVSQNLANGIIKANNRAMVHVSFLL